MFSKAVITSSKEVYVSFLCLELIKTQQDSRFLQGSMFLSLNRTEGQLWLGHSISNAPKKWPKQDTACVGRPTARSRGPRGANHLIGSVDLDHLTLCARLCSQATQVPTPWVFVITLRGRSNYSWCFRSDNWGTESLNKSDTHALTTSRCQSQYLHPGQHGPRVSALFHSPVPFPFELPEVHEIINVNYGR